MRLILRKKTHQRLLRIYQALGKESRFRSRLCFGRTMRALDAMHELMTRRSSWEERGRWKI